MRPYTTAILGTEAPQTLRSVDGVLLGFVPVGGEVLMCHNWGKCDQEGQTLPKCGGMGLGVRKLDSKYEHHAGPH